MVPFGREGRIKRVAQFLATQFFSKGSFEKITSLVMIRATKVKNFLRTKSKRSKVMLALQARPETQSYDP